MEIIRKKMEAHTTTVCEIIESVCSDMCDNFCKWPNQYGSSDEDQERLYDEHCGDCPLRNLV